MTPLGLAFFSLSHPLVVALGLGSGALTEPRAAPSPRYQSHASSATASPLDPELCVFLASDGMSQAGPRRFPWHAAMLPEFSAPASIAAPIDTTAETTPAPPRLTGDDVRRLLLAGRGAQAWEELRWLEPAGDSDEAYLKAWTAGRIGAPEAARLLLPFSRSGVPPECRIPAMRAAAAALLSEGRIAEADGLLSDLAMLLPDIPDHVLLWSIEARVQAAAGRSTEQSDQPASVFPARRALAQVDSLVDELSAYDPLPALLARADRARARLLGEAGESERARSLLITLLPRTPRRERADLLLELARLELRLGHGDVARGRLRQVVELHPESAAALELLEASAALEPVSSPRDRARILAEHGRVEEAVAVLTPTTDPALLRLRGDLHLRAEDFPAAVADYQEAMSRGEDTEELRLDLAKAYARGSDPRRAREIYEGLTTEQPESPTLLYLIADAFQEEAAVAPALADSAAAVFRLLIARHPRASLAERSLMRLAHLRFSQRAWHQAEDLFEDYLRRYPAGEDRREARYWLARTVYESGRRGEARELLRQLLDGDGGYYALLARRRLGGAAGDPAAGLYPGPGAGGDGRSVAAGAGDSSAAWRSATETGAALLPSWNPGTASIERARALLQAGEIAAAEREVDEAVRLAGRSHEALRDIARWAIGHGFPESAFRIGSAFAPTAGAEHADAPLAFPAAFAENVLLEARESGVSPGLLWAIMRQESRFDPSARSPAGAVGLLQLMPPTAREEALAAGLDDFNVTDLSRPESNLHLGALHLRRVLDSVGGEWAAAIASYNAGFSQADRWRRFPESRAGAETYVERIPFRETRNYVKQVITNYAHYATLYASR